ncbi:hypothetical protein DPMN_017726 [Dreissena polymorpha]|uniref:Uncharacterized protein n=1 Tax=Dreissena polymorpha TaxID=45954 RepID=A0A9D4S7Q8_DREPO|nr:hypothetical protein DPMN_017726 [Dreissena polymorpha]
MQINRLQIINIINNVQRRQQGHLMQYRILSRIAELYLSRFMLFVAQVNCINRSTGWINVI